MKLTRNKIFSEILIFGLIANLLVCFNIQYFYLRAIFSFIFLTIIPGLLIMLILKIRKIGFWEYLVYTIGLSIAFLMFGGLLINWILPLTGISQPLSLIPISISLNYFLLIFGLVGYLRNKDISYEFKFIKLSLLNWIFFLSPIIFPILSIFGAISLNNQGPNILTMIMLGGIALYVSLIIIFRKKLNQNIYPLAIFFIATSLLFMTSLRGWYITGHDVQQEYYVFQLTKSNFQWSPSLFRDPYNACLSLNILPTAFSSFSNMNDIYIYKALFQIIFSFTVIGIFLFFKRYTHKSIAFLSVFLFMSFPTFINDMPMLNRQEMALLFFALMLLALFNKTIKPRLKEILFLVFGFSMVVSHYSTSYVAVALFITTYLISFILKRNFIKEKVKIGNEKYYLTLVMVLGIVIFTFFWNTQIAQTSGGLTRLVIQTWQNINKSFSQDLKSGDVLYNLFSWKKLDKEKLLNEYISEETKNTDLNEDKHLYYDKSIYGKYKISLLDEETLPLTPLGKRLSEFSINVFLLNFYLRQITAKVIQILIILGFIILFLKNSKYVKDIDTEYNILALVCIFLLGLLIILPMFSIEYGTLRFFQQTLIVLALPVVIGNLMIFNFFNKNINFLLPLTIFIIFFLSLSGFIPQVSGGYYPQLNLNNQGISYDCDYTHKPEVASTSWLIGKFDDKYGIQSNDSVHSKMLAIIGLASSGNILPVIIKKDTYIYLDYSNVMNKKNTIYFKGNSIIYDYPVEFLNESKNLIYNNQGSQIFK